MKNRNIFLNWKQKILLNLLVALESKECSRLKIFKLSFLLSQKINFYDFVPYKYGPYSFEMDKDLRMFNKNGWINIKENLINIDYNSIKSFTDEIIYKCVIQDVVNKFSNMVEKDLLDLIYKKYPFYTIHSILAKSYKYKKQTTPKAIYTIGYEGLSIDSFINILIKKDIKTVLDVRNKPFSYKYGFNYSWLKKYLPEFGIEYINIPELGIEEEYRKTFSFENLWVYYSFILNRKKDVVNKISNFFKKQPSALMCYEKSPDFCHRLRLAKRIQDLTNLPIINFDSKKNQWIELNY